MKLALILVIACGPSADALYAAQQSDCAIKATSREESKACRAQVDANWKVDSGSQDGGDHGD